MDNIKFYSAVVGASTVLTVDYMSHYYCKAFIKKRDFNHIDQIACFTMGMIVGAIAFKTLEMI